jgi:1-acyl-sn-glycerol-3-phosphate acyltransferase
MTVIYDIGVALTKFFFTLFGQWKVDGRKLVPRHGPLILVCNHLSNADGPALCASMPRRVQTMAKRSLFSNKLLGWILRAWGVYPAETGQRSAKTIAWALETLGEGRVLAIFPESTRSPHGMRKAMHGAAYLAARTGAMIVPIGITGTENIPGFWRIAFPLCRISVKIGEPFKVSKVSKALQSSALETMTTEIMQHVAALLPEDYRGVYSTEI